MSARIRVVLADDHALLREGIKALLSRSEDIEVVGEAADGNQAVEVCRKLDPDVVVMDIAMPGLGGLEAALILRKERPRIKVLVLTQYEDREYVQRFLKIGASGYVLKRAAGDELAAAIRSVQKGGLVLDPQIAREAVLASEAGVDEAAGDPWDRLTDRERQVLKLVAEGKTNKEVASLLAISLKTAMSHRESVMEKLGLHNRTDLIRFAIKQGVITA